MASKAGRGRIRVFFAEVEGDDETIQEGLQAINVAANKIFQSSPTKIIKVLSPSALPIEEDELLEDIDAEDEEEDLSVRSVATKTKPKKSASHKPPNMAIVKDLNLRPEDQISWKDFYAQKNPDTQQQAITVAVYYLKQILELDKISPEHVFTCFKDVGRKPPNDMPGTIRDIARKKGWVDTSERGNIKITNHGENLVEHDLPTSKGKKNS